MRAADAGNVDDFRKNVEARVAEGEVDVGEAQDIARRFMSRQIETARGPSGRGHLDTISSTGTECVAAFDGPLARRAEHQDELAARAAMIRLDAGLIEPMSYAHLLTSSEPHWRAVAARSLGVPSPTPHRRGVDDPGDLVRAATWRHKLMLDPSTDVRVAVLKASYDAVDPSDVPHALEAARLDPDPEVRRTAIQAIGKIGTREGVIGLMDLWTRADEEERLAIVGAWAATARGHKELGEQVGCTPSETRPDCVAWHKLQRISELGEGMPSLVASLELIHDVAPNSAGTPEGNAAAVVERMIDDASTRIRVEAIESAPLSWPYLAEAIVAASKGDDARVAVAALARVTELSDKERPDALAALRTHAKERGLAGEEARTALASLGDSQVVPLLSTDASAKSANQRAGAAQGYARLGAMGPALQLLADRDASVRARAACAILVN